MIKQASKILIALMVVFSQPVAADVRSEPSPVNIRLEIKSFDSEAAALDEAQELLARSDSNQRQTTIISSDSFQFLDQVRQNPSIRNGRNFVVLNDAISRFTKAPVDYIKKSYRDDRIGFAIAIYTTAVETVMWVHVAPMSTLAISANIAFTIGTAIYFRLNKDKWTEVTDQMKTPLRKFFGDVENNSVRNRMFYDFLANLGLSSALAFARVPLMSMSQILDEGITLGMLKMPLLMSIVGTASLFTWSEHHGSIDKKTYPISKFVFRRIGELRTVLLVTFASTAALLNPATFGVMPWVTLTVVGAGGMLTYLKADQINEWIERSPIFRKLESIVRMNSDHAMPSAAGLSCRMLFN